MAATKPHLSGKINTIDTEMKSLTTQMKSFVEPLSAQVSLLDANMELRLNKLENRFLVIFFAVAVGSSGAAAATLILFQTLAIQTPAAQTPIVRIPTTQAPTVGQNWSKRENIANVIAGITVSGPGR
jgi:hypothetical protein